MAITDQQKKIMEVLKELGTANSRDLKTAFLKKYNHIGNLTEQLGKLKGKLLVEQNECNEYKLTTRGEMLLKGEKVGMQTNSNYSPKDLKEIQEYAKNPDLFETLADDFNPALIGIKEAKIATILAMISASDNKGDKQRVSVLLVGAPGTGKSQLIEYAKYNFWGVITDHEASNAGLRGTVRGDQDPIPGALAQADESTLFIDELDKMDTEDQNALLQSLQSGRYQITLAGQNKTIDARVRVVATANNTNRISRPLLDRFDLIIQLPKVSQEDKESLMGNKILMWGKDKKKEEDIITLKNFISYANTFETKIPDDRTELIDIVQNEMRNGCLKTLDTRQNEGVIRLAISIAKLRLHPTLDPEDIKTAIELIKKQQETNQS